MTHDDAGEDTLAGIDLHTWRVPPPAELHRPSLLVRGLSPAVPARRSRVGWIVAGIVLVNAAIATIIVILLARPAPAPAPVAVAAGGGSVDSQVRVLMKRLAREQRVLEQKLVEIERLQAQIEELKEKVRQAERRDPKRPVPDRQAPVSIPPVADCDEVSCVLGNYEAACCAKYRKPRPRTATRNPLPEGLDRAMISTGISLVKSRVSDCANQSTAKGMVKVRVRVSPAGRVTSSSIDSTPDPLLGACVAKVVERAVFERTQNGGAFSFPFMF